MASYITDPVTTTDELIPSGETSSYRSNPLGLAEFTLSRKDPAYVGRAKEVQAEEAARRAGKGDEALLARIRAVPGCEALTWDDVQIASTIFAVKPGDGSAREQAASCQRVLGAGANIAVEYATKRYRSNLINWGMLPFQIAGPTPFGLGGLYPDPERPQGPGRRPVRDRGLCAGRPARRFYPVHRAADQRRAADPGGRLPHQLLQALNASVRSGGIRLSGRTDS